MKMGQLFDNSFTLRYCSLKLSLSLHKQIKSAAFEGQDRYCIISSDWCIISSVVTVCTLYIQCTLYSMPQRVGHASLGNLEVLHQKANGSTIVFTHCEQENAIK